MPREIVEQQQAVYASFFWAHNSLAHRQSFLLDTVGGPGPLLCSGQLAKLTANVSSQQQTQLTPILENEEPRVLDIKNDTHLSADERQARIIGNSSPGCRVECIRREFQLSLRGKSSWRRTTQEYFYALSRRAPVPE